MEIVDLSIDDPEMKIKDIKNARNMLNDLKKYVPFLKHLCDLGPIENAKYTQLINWLQTSNHSNLNRCQIILCEKTIRKKYERLKNIANLPTHIIEIFEGGLSIVISDDDEDDVDSVLPSTSSIFKKDKIITNDTEAKIQNSITKEQSSTSSNKISQSLQGSKPQIESEKKTETRRKKQRSDIKKNKLQTNSSSKISSKSRSSSKYGKDLSEERKYTNSTNTKKVDASVFDIVSWNDLEKDIAKKPVLEKDPSNRSYTQVSKNDTNNKIDQRKKSELDKKKKKKHQHNSKKVDKEPSVSEHQSYESLMNQKNEIIKLLRKEDKKINQSTKTEIPKEVELFQRRESRKSERKKSFIELSIIEDSVSVLKKNPEIIVEIVNDSLGPKIVYDYTNITKTTTTKTIPVINTTNKPNLNITQKSETSEPKILETNNNYTSGDEYRKAMLEQQLDFQFQQQTFSPPKLQCPLNCNSSKSSKSQNYDVDRSSITKTKKISQSDQPLPPNLKSSSRIHGDHRLISEEIQNKHLKSLSTDFDRNIKNQNCSEIQRDLTERKTKHKEDDEVVLMSFGERGKLIHNFRPKMINGVTCVEKVNSVGLSGKGRAHESSKQPGSLSSSLKSKPRISKDCDLSKTKPSSALISNKIDMPKIFQKHESRERSSEHKKAVKSKHDSVNKKLESADVFSNISKEANDKSESRKTGSKERKRKNSVSQDNDCCLKQKLPKIGHISKKNDFKVTEDCSHIDKNKNNCIKCTDKSIKIKVNQIDCQLKHSTESTNKINNKLSKKKTKISNQTNKELIQAPSKFKNSSVADTDLKLNTDCLDIDKRKDSKQKEAIIKCFSEETTHTTIKLKENCNATQKDLKRKPSVGSSKEVNNPPVKRKPSVGSLKEVNNPPVKKSKMSTPPNKDTSPKKATNSPARRFYRELNNLTCTFKQSLLPQTIRRRRCSSSFVNLSENVSQKSKNADLKPAPIQRRRKTTCIEMPNLKLTLRRLSPCKDKYHIKSIENDRPSDDFHEIDIDKDRGRNNEIFNRDISNTISSSNKEIKEMPRLVPFDLEPTQTSPKTPDNNDSKMTFKSTKTCVLCNKNSNDLTNHYVVKHKTESYVSRLSSADIRGLENKTNVADQMVRNRFRITCVFCKQKVEDRFENFYAHFAYHTGEYNYQCEGCQIKKPYKEDIGSHQLRSRVCRNSQIIKIHNYEFETTTIYLHVCKICNFVNLNQLNLKNHLRKQHGIKSNELEKSKRCILVVKDAEENVSENNCETNLNNNDTTPEIEEAPLSPEQELPMDIENILKDEDNSAIGHESHDKTRSNESKSVMSPEELLEEMHAPNSAKNTMTNSVSCESFTRDSFDEDINALSNENLQVSETCTNIITVAQSSKQNKINHEVESYTNKMPCQDPKMLHIHDRKNSLPIINCRKKVHCKIRVEKKLSSREKSNQNIVKSLEDSHDLESSINSTKEINNSSKKTNKEKRHPSKFSTKESNIENYFEDYSDSETLTSIEAYIKSTNESSNRRIQALDNPNSMPINNISSENICKSPEGNLKKSSIEETNEIKEKQVDENSVIERNTSMQLPNKISSKSLTEHEVEPVTPQQRHLIIYRKYDRLDSNNFGLLKCLMEDCLYSTNSEKEFKIHWSNHNQTKILKCPYCLKKSSCLETIIHHIWNEHRMSNFQCVNCSYRSMVPGNVIIHHRICHKDIITDDFIYKCGNVKLSTKSKHKVMTKKVRNNIANLKCPECAYSFFSAASIKSHLQKSHPLTFQRFSSLNLNELACIHCKKQLKCKEAMQVHLAFKHPDEPAFVIQRKLEPNDSDDAVADLMVVDITLDVLETVIRTFEQNESPNVVNGNKNQKALNKLETNNTVTSLNSSKKHDRSPDSCAIDCRAELRSEACLTNSSTSPLKEMQNSPIELGTMKETPQTEKNCFAEEDIIKTENINILSTIYQDPNHLQIQSPNELCEPVQSTSIDNHHLEHVENEQSHLHESCGPVQSTLIDNHNLEHVENELLEIPFESTSNNFREAVSKEGDRIKSLLELLVENTGVHRSTLYRCPNCNSSFMHFDLWLVHIKNKHKKIEDVDCPYCMQQLELDSAESHFQNHLRHEYICYYCITSYCSKKKIQEHFELSHDNSNTIALPIASFYLVIKEDAIISDYTALLEHFADEIYLQLTEKIQRHTVKEWTAGMTDSCLYELEIPRYKPDGQPLFKCFVALCDFVASNENSLDDHLLQHELPTTFKCTYCPNLNTYPSWENIKYHNLQHMSPCLYICCVCKYVHYNNEGIIKHIENLHNSRDVPVLFLQRSNLYYKVSLSIFLPPNKISFTTSKACFCCAQEIRNSYKFIHHLKKFHKLTLCPRCQICGKIIFTQFDGEAHYKESHQMESFKVKYEILTTYLYNLVVTSRSPLTVEIRLKKEKNSNQQIQSNHNETSSVLTVKEEILLKSELEEDKQKEVLSIKCLHTNQLLQNSSEQHTHQITEMADSSIQELESFIANHDAQTSTEGMTIGNNTGSSQPQNSDPAMQYQQLHSPHKLVQPSTTIQHCVPFSKSLVQYPSQQQQSIRKETSAQNQAPPSNYTLMNREKDSLPSNQKQHVVLKEIQLTTGNAILSIPLEAPTAEQPRTIEDFQRIPVITTRNTQQNIPQIATTPASIPLIPGMQTYTRPLPNTSVPISQVNRPNLDEIAPICGICHFECIDFIHLQSHYEETHVMYNQGFYFYVDRKVGCMYCHFQGILKSFDHHHATVHPDKRKLCRNVNDHIRCGICNDIFRYPLSYSANNYSVSSLCACPGYQRTIADCLNLPILKTLQDIGYQYRRYSCEVCRLSFQSAQEFAYHNLDVHQQYIDPEVLRKKLKFYCYMCPSALSDNVFKVISHMRFSHLNELTHTLIQRFEYYKRIRIIHPNGFVISFDDLRNTGEFDLEMFKEKIYSFEAEYIFSL